MNMDSIKIKDWFDGFKLTTPIQDVKVIVAPPSAYLMETKALANQIKIVEVAGQDVSQYEKGAHTGELAAFELKEFANYCIVGHSERHETTEMTLQKIQMCLANNIMPIVCFVDKNLLGQIPQLQSCVVCLEDPQNISQNGVYSPKPILEIKTEVENIKKTWPNCTLLYGGSVSGQTTPELVKIDGLDGVLVGNSSLDPMQFAQIVSEYGLRKP